MKKKNKEKGSVIDVLGYHLSPKMEVLNEAAKKQLIEKLNISSLMQLPLFKPNDPAVKALGAKPGDVIKIYREDATGKYIVYRYVFDEEVED